MSKPLLTVAIPTYNRPETLEKIIKELIQEANQNFILLIADDSANNHTERMVKKYLKKWPNLVYIKNKNNLGFNENVAQLYNLTTTKYLWYLCDDDTVVVGAIDNIIKALKKYQPTVAVFNCSWINPYGQKRIAGVESDKVYISLKNLTDYQPLMRTTFLSILVVMKTSSIDKLLTNNYKDNIFFQVTLALYLLNQRFNYVEVKDPIVHRNVGYKYGEFVKFNLVDHLKAVTFFKNKFNLKLFISWSKAQLPTAFLLYFSQKVGLFTFNGQPTKQTLKLLFKYYGLFALWVLFFKALYLITPAILVKITYFMKLYSLYGFKNAKKVYKQNVNRAYNDKRKTGFVNYR